MNDKNIINLFGLSNRTAILIDLIERAPLTIDEIDIARIAKRYSNVHLYKLNMNNSATVKRRALDYFIEQGFVSIEKWNDDASHRRRLKHIYHLDVSNPIIQGIIPLLKNEVNEDV